MNQTQQPLARLQNVSRTFGKVRALSDVSLTIEPGEVVALLGPNGAGKTTLVNILLGLIRPDQGEASLFGGDPRAPINVARTGVMLQASGVPDTLKVRELLQMFAGYYPAPLPVNAIARQVGLEGLMNRFYGKLSGGQKQRTLFAIALIGDPQLLFLDEPTVGLDVESRRTLWEQVRNFAAKGRSVLLTTHHLEEADALANRIIVLDRGRIIAQGSNDEIRNVTPGTQVLCRTVIPVGTISGWDEVSKVSTESGKLRILTSQAETTLRKLLDADPNLSRLEVKEAALEDAFLAITGRTERNAA